MPGVQERLGGGDQWTRYKLKGQLSSLKQIDGFWTAKFGSLRASAKFAKRN